MAEVANLQEYRDQLRAQREADRRARLNERLNQNDTVQQEDQEKPGLITLVIALLIAIPLDLIEGATLGTIGWLVALFGDFVLLAIMGITSGGRKQFFKVLAGVGLEKIPVINVLPIRTAMVIWAFVSSQPKIMSKINTTLRVASKIPSPIAPQLKVAAKASNEMTRGVELSQKFNQYNRRQNVA